MDPSLITGGQLWFGEDALRLDLNGDTLVDFVHSDLLPGADGVYSTGDERSHHRDDRATVDYRRSRDSFGRLRGFAAGTAGQSECARGPLSPQRPGPDTLPGLQAGPWRSFR